MVVTLTSHRSNNETDGGGDVVVPARSQLLAGSSGHLDLGVIRLRLRDSGAPETCGPSGPVHQRHRNHGAREVRVWLHAGRIGLFRTQRAQHQHRAERARGGRRRRHRFHGAAQLTLLCVLPRRSRLLRIRCFPRRRPRMRAGGVGSPVTCVRDLHVSRHGHRVRALQTSGGADRQQRRPPPQSEPLGFAAGSLQLLGDVCGGQLPEDHAVLGSPAGGGAHLRCGSHLHPGADAAVALHAASRAQQEHLPAASHHRPLDPRQRPQHVCVVRGHVQQPAWSGRHTQTALDAWRDGLHASPHQHRLRVVSGLLLHQLLPHVHTRLSENYFAGRGRRTEHSPVPLAA
ncbi:DNA damage-regulated autophagy modulator protein 2b isoform X1 [Entelurus aequoreus]|uniref:DNA damage-regulated autophagy modulator protein 2b isoform X1 n=1 Tax=Entelurus aequoreus TaxID=161455 RepID=UPI002B1E764C|nr:DNA damage-regulated autophagy modulator protein 2b isoform X1 [Entelurus aequoreus]